MTTPTNTEPAISATRRYIESADELVKLARQRIADSQEEVEAFIADLQERLDNEDDDMTIRERNLVSLSIGVLQYRANILWRMSRG